MDFSTTTGIVLMVYILAEGFKALFLTTDRKRQYVPMVCAIIGMLLGLLFFFMQTALGINVFGDDISLLDAIGSGISSGLAATGVNQVIKKRFGTIDPKTSKEKLEFSTDGVSGLIDDLNSSADKDVLVSEAEHQPTIEADKTAVEANATAVATEPTGASIEATTDTASTTEAAETEVTSENNIPADATQEAVDPTAQSVVEEQEDP